MAWNRRFSKLPMGIQQQRILDYLVAYWREQCNLIPAADVSEMFHIPEIEELRGDGG